jgi:hypothetical protein
MEGYKDIEITKITKYSTDRVSAICYDYAKNGISEFSQENSQQKKYKNTLDKGQVIAYNILWRCWRAESSKVSFCKGSKILQKATQ